MKIKNIILFVAVMLGVFFTSCEEYLDKSPYSNITEENVFVNFVDFQAFIEVNYSRITDYNQHGQNSTTCYDDASIGKSGSHYKVGQIGDYWELYNGSGGASGPLSVWSTQSGTVGSGAANTTGYWFETWQSLRANNMALEKLDMLQGTARQKELIEGQAKFFRAFFVAELSKWIGGLPYIKRTLSSEGPFNEKKLTPMETMDNAAIDFDDAARLLPRNWDELSVVDHPYQTYDPVTGLSSNTGRATKGAAYAMKAISMLWAGSPLCNFSSKGHVRPDGQTVSGTYDFDPYYMEEAAKAAFEVIKLAENDNFYQLVGMDEYQSFTASLGSNNWVSKSGRKEIIWARAPQKLSVNGEIGKNFCPNGIGSSAGRNVHATENQLARYETTAGLPIDDSSSGYNPQNPFANRDPRLKASIIVPNEVIYSNIKLQSWRTGTSRSKMASSLLIRKFIVQASPNPGGNYVTTPFARLAEMYLIYAEAVNEKYGPNTKPAWGKYTAVEALNVVRSRAKSYSTISPDYLKPIMPPVNAKFTTSKEVFRQRIWNERDVELAYEAKRFFDIRRWHIGTDPSTKLLYSLECDLVGTNLANFSKEYMATRTFDEKHYWVPIPKKQGQLSDAFPQTVGW